MSKNRDHAYNPLLKSYPDSDKVNDVSEGAECLYCRLIAQSDDAGRYSAEPLWVLARLFTTRMAHGLNAEAVAERIDELARVGLIELYEVGGKRYLQIVDVFKTVRKDVKQKFVYPQPLTERVTDTARVRNGYGPLDQTRPDLELEQTFKNPTTEPPTKRAPAATESPKESRASKNSILTPEALADLHKLRAWYEHEQARPDSKVEASESFWTNTQAAAAKASTAEGIADRVALFKFIVFGRKWSYLRAADDELAASLRLSLNRADRNASAAFLEQLSTIGNMPKE
jgi:hypothetical protein